MILLMVLRGELTDELVIWMWELMLLRKKQIEEK